MSSIIISFLAKSTFLYFSYNLISYYRLYYINNLFSSSGQIDLSYEKLPSNPTDQVNFQKKYFLLVGTNKNQVYLTSLFEQFNIKTLKINAFLKENIEIQSETNEFNHIKVISKRRFLQFFDCSNLKSTLVSRNFSQVHEINSVFNRIRLGFTLMNTFFYKNNDVYYNSKGLLSNQRLLVMGRFEFDNLNKTVFIKPKFVVCSGVVEFEEIIQYLMSQKSVRLFRITCFLGLLCVFDLSYRGYMKNDKKNKNSI